LQEEEKTTHGKKIGFTLKICKRITNITIQARSLLNWDEAPTHHWAAEYNTHTTTNSSTALAICQQKKSNNDIIMRIVHMCCSTG